MGYFSGKYSLSKSFKQKISIQLLTANFSWCIVSRSRLDASVQVYYVMELQQNKYQKKTRSNGSRVNKKESYVQIFVPAVSETKFQLEMQKQVVNKF